MKVPAPSPCVAFFVTCLALCALRVSPEVGAMVSLSGVLHGLLAGGGPLLALLAIELVVEALHGPHPFTRLALGSAVAPPAFRG